MQTKTLKLEFIVFSTFLLSSCFTETPKLKDSPIPEPPISEITRPVPKLFEKKVVLVAGFNFETKSPVVLDSTTGNEILPCSSDTAQSNNYGKSNRKYQTDIQQSLHRVLNSESHPCITKDTSDIDTFRSLENLEKSLPKAILKKDENTNEYVQIEAIPKVSVAYFYPGSNCVTYITAGKRYEICSTLKSDCQTLLPLGVYGYLPEPDRRNIRNTCKQFKTAWHIPDCKQLKPVYRSNYMPYSLPYEQFVWDTCNTVSESGNWGSRPK